MAFELYYWCSDVSWILIITLSYLIFYRYLLKTWWYFDQRDVKYVRGMPLLGSRYRAILGLDNESNVLSTLYNIFPDEPFIGIYDLFGKPSYIIRDPYLVKQLSVTTNSTVPNNKNIVGNKKATNSLNNRTFLTDNNVNDVFTLINDSSRQFCESLLNSEAFGSNDYEAKDLFGRFACNIIGTCVLGTQINTLEDKNSEFFRACCSISNWNCIKHLKLFDYVGVEAISNYLQLKISGPDSINTFRTVLRKKIEKRCKPNFGRNDLINLILKSKDDYTNDDVLNDHLNYLWNGFYIVHTAMPFLIYELAINPDVQTSLFNEIRARNEQQGKFGYVDLSELKYMDNVISESLRLWSPAQFTRKYIDTTTIEHFENVKVDPNFMELNVGDSIIIPTHALHMDEQYFLNPEKFDPSRFDGNAIKDGTFYPFGCEKGEHIASEFATLQMKTVLFHLITSFVIDRSEKTQDPLRLKTSISYLDSKYGYWIGLRKRK